MKFMDYSIRAKNGNQVYWWTGKLWSWTPEEAKSYATAKAAKSAARQIPQCYMEDIEIWAFEGNDESVKG